MTKKPNILIVYTGGTIGMVKDYGTGALKAFDFSQISNKIPELQQLNCTIETISFKEPIDSSNMNIDYYVEIAEIIASNYNSFDGFVVLTGSDTMSYISSAISFMFENLQKPVIFTGSQLPIGDLRTDAKENLITSVQIAASSNNGEPIIQEVGLYFEYKLYRANRTTKISAEQFEAFTSMNYPPLVESGVHLNFNYPLLLRLRGDEKELVFRKKFDNNIAVLKLFPGITEKVVRSYLGIEGLRGLVLETYGAGNAPTTKWFLDILREFVEKGVYVVNVTQCAGGSVILGHYETSSDLKNLGIIDGKDITTETAIAKMMYLLGENLTKGQFKRYFELPLRGEIRE
ncbi:L-asparaginase [Tenacibaculum sp. MAR_2009_124]|uniref:asparaginase n=1 Tax=Tenacibaculum sp. MAR_2009_124 TaxID=1250059 RepID=UPI00089467EC|nr:asparaginase [Tenacibaculum sp. MAR_2009_124]SED19806.1 L-asparaginase [Tenacibaculum sp. MAR_2009_124]